MNHTALNVEIGLEDVFIPGELERRPPTVIDHLQEKVALQELAARLVDAPDDVLPKFVERAMDLAGGVSAGLSLYEEEDGTLGVFRWHHLCGMLEPFNGATTPRNFSPCGITLDRRAPVLATHAERMYSWIADANIVVPEVLLVPLYIGGLEPLGTLWIVSDRIGHFNSAHAHSMTELATFVGIALRLQKNERELKKALTEQETLAKEMSHRVQNLFTMVQSIVAASARNTQTPKDMAQAVSGRVLALAHAHGLVRRGFSDQTPPRTADLGSLVEAIIAPHKNAPCRFIIKGPVVLCGDRTTNGLALLLHELATNAVKYGALSAEAGRIEIEWLLADGTLSIRWREQGGPPITAAPQRKGFGTTLSQAMVAQLGGDVRYGWRPDGLQVAISVLEASLAR